jgi:streptogramin lyase
LCGQAGPGEILASREACHLARKVDGARYADRGELTLKNLAEPFRGGGRDPGADDPAEHFRALAVEREAERRRLGSERPAGEPVIDVSAGEEPTPPGRRGVFVAVGLLALVAGGAAFLLAGGRAAAPPGNPVAPRHDTLVRVDALTGQPSAKIQVGPGATAVAVGGGSAWVVDSDAEVVQRVDLRTNRVAQRIKVGIGPDAICYTAGGGGAVWVANRLNGTVTRIDASTGRTTTVLVGQGITAVAAWASSVWVVNRPGGTVARIDVGSNTVVETVRLRDVADAAALQDGALLATTSAGGTEADLFRFRTGAKRPRFLTQLFDTSSANGAPTRIAFDAGRVWATETEKNSLWTADLATLRARPAIPVGSTPIGLAVDGSGNAWVIGAFDHSLWKESGDQLSGLNSQRFAGQPVAVSAHGTDVVVLTDSSRAG